MGEFINDPIHSVVLAEAFCICVHIFANCLLQASCTFQMKSYAWMSSFLLAFSAIQLGLANAGDIWLVQYLMYFQAVMQIHDCYETAKFAHFLR